MRCWIFEIYDNIVQIYYYIDVQFDRQYAIDEILKDDWNIDEFKR